MNDFGGVVIPVLVGVVLTLIVNTLGGQLIAWLNRLTPAEGFNVSGMLQNRGEFVLILATLATAAGLDPRLTPFAGLYVLFMAIVGPVLAVNSERAGARIFRPRRRGRRRITGGPTIATGTSRSPRRPCPDASRDDTAFEIAASEPPFEVAEVTGGVDDEVPTAAEERLAAQAGVQSDVSEPARPVREPDPEY